MIAEIVTIVCVPLGRAVLGWAENAFKDGKITGLEYKQLGETVLRIGVPAAALLYGFNLPISMAVTAPIIADYVYSYIKKLKGKKKK